MDYMDVLLRFRNDNNIAKHLDKYFVREWKKAEEQYYEPEEFFDGLQTAVNQIKSGCYSAYEARKSELDKMLYHAEKEGDIETISYCENEKRHLKIIDFSCPLYFYHKSYSGHLNLKQLEYIELQVKNAQEKVSEAKKRVNDSSQKKHPARYYAVYHWILIEMGIEKPFEKNEDDKFPKEEIIAFAKNKYPKCSSQQFYAEFRDFDITKMLAFANTYKGYKERIIDISNNDSRIISHLKKYPN